jgi:hypothetical protein
LFQKRAASLPLNRLSKNVGKESLSPTIHTISLPATRRQVGWSDAYRSKEHIEELGKKLYVKITEVISAEVEAVTEQDCIDYMLQLVIDRTFDGYMTEIKTVYGQLEKELMVKIEPAPDKWDRLFNVDFFINMQGKYIGIQIKPVHQGIQLSQIFKEKDLQAKSHQAFTKQYGGKVFYVFSSKVGERKEIRNKEVILEIKQEIERLKTDMTG